jgi:hypothetical protein
MNKLAEVLHSAFWVNAPERLYRLSATGATVWNDAFLFEAATVKVFFNMGDDHVPLAYEDSAPMHEFQTFDKARVVQAGS